MKRCPTCTRTYADDDLNFCLDDGSVLQRLTEAGTPETFLLNRVDTSDVGRPPATMVQPGVPPTKPEFTMKKGSSRGGLWAIVALGLLVVLCGGGAAAVGIFLASVSDDPQPYNRNDRNDRRNANNRDDRRSNSNVEVVDGDKQVIDLSGWLIDDGSGIMEVIDGEYVLRSLNKDYYYVLIAKRQFITEDAVTTVTVRNTKNRSTDLGYGLVFHSDSKPLVKDYAFLLDTTKSRYRVVKHSPNTETEVVKWTRSSSIKDGTDKNVLEVRDRNGQIDLYINGTKVNSIRNTDGAPSGVAGLYAGDAVPVAFSDFSITR